MKICNIRIFLIFYSYPYQISIAPYMRPDMEETYADITAPLRKLTAHGKHFKWTKECQVSFQKLKDLLRSDTVLVSYDPTRHTRVYVDHGPDGVASTLTQRYEVAGQREPQYRPVTHNSRSNHPHLQAQKKR